MKRNLNLDPDLETLVSSPGVGVRTGPYIPLYSQPQWVLTSASKSSIRRFVITEKAPTRAQLHIERPWGQRQFSIVS